MGVQKTIQQKITVFGKGESKQHAFAEALGQIQGKLMKQSEVLLRVEPLEVDVLKATEEKYTERFLFFFFPRKRTSFEVELAVTVEVTEIELKTVPFTTVQTEDPNGVVLPFVSKKI